MPFSGKMPWETTALRMTGYTGTTRIETLFGVYWSRVEVLRSFDLPFCYMVHSRNDEGEKLCPRYKGMVMASLSSSLLTYSRSHQYLPRSLSLFSPLILFNIYCRPDSSHYLNTLISSFHSVFSIPSYIYPQVKNVFQGSSRYFRHLCCPACLGTQRHHQRCRRRWWPGHGSGC